jgi:hypothetical protein
VAKHQAICQKLSSKRPRPTFQVKRTYNEGGSAGAVIGVSACGKGGGRGAGKGRSRSEGASLASKPAPQPGKTHWRAQSEAFRAAIRSARGAPPMPQWGSGNGHPAAGRAHASAARGGRVGPPGPPRARGGSERRAARRRARRTSARGGDFVYTGSLRPIARVAGRYPQWFGGQLRSMGLGCASLACEAG